MMKVRLKILTSEVKGQEFEVEADAITIGRASDNLVVLDEKSVSRYHARIVSANGRAVLEDLDSRNRTQVEGLKVMRPTELGDGAVVSFGDVMAEVRLPGLAERAEGGGIAPTGPDAEEATTSKGEKRVSLKMGASVPRGLPPEWLEPAGGAAVPERRFQQKVAESTLWGGLLLLLGLIAAGFLTAYFLYWSRLGPAPAYRFGATVHVGETQLIQVPWGFWRKPAIEDADVVAVERPLKIQRAVALVGRSEGFTAVKLYNEEGAYARVYVKVLPRPREDVAESLGEMIKTPQQRVSLALEAMRRGDALKAGGQLYAAWQQYGKALNLLEPYAGNPNREYLQAKRRYDGGGDEIQQRYDRLSKEVQDFINVGDKRTALEKLARMKELIADPDDVRRQNADLLYRLLGDIIKREKKGERRGL